MQSNLIKTVLTGIGQIFLQQNALSGAIIAIAMLLAIGHWHCPACLAR